MVQSRITDEDNEIEAPREVWLHVHADADCWCCYHFDEDDDPRHLTKYVRTDARSDLARKVLEVVEAQKYGIPEDDGVEFCLTALRELFEKEGVEV